MRVPINRLATLFLVLMADRAAAQVTASSLTELQRGRVPGVDSLAVSNLYEQFDVDYIQHGIQAGFRAEIFNTWRNIGPGSRLSQVEYRVVHIAQKHLRWTNGPTELVTGQLLRHPGPGNHAQGLRSPGGNTGERSIPASLFALARPGGRHGHLGGASGRGKSPDRTTRIK